MGVLQNHTKNMEDNENEYEEGHRRSVGMRENNTVEGHNELVEIVLHFYVSHGRKSKHLWKIVQNLGQRRPLPVYMYIHT